jgi:hypothetical protein
MAVHKFLNPKWRLAGKFQSAWAANRRRERRELYIGRLTAISGRFHPIGAEYPALKAAPTKDALAVAFAVRIWHRSAGRWSQAGDAIQGCGCSSGVEHDLAKVGVEGSNPFARSNFLFKKSELAKQPFGAGFLLTLPSPRSAAPKGPTERHAVRLMHRRPPAARRREFFIIPPRFGRGRISFSNHALFENARTLLSLR